MAVELDNKTGKWFFYGKYPKTHPKAGKQYKKRGFSSAKKAQKAEKEFRDGISDISTEIADMTFKELTDHYLEYASRKIKESSVMLDRSRFNTINKKLGDIKLNQLNYSIIQDYFDSIKDEYVETTIKNMHSAIQKTFKFAIRKGWMKTNHMQQVEMPKHSLDEVKEDILFWTPHQFELFIKNVDDLKYKTLFIVMFYMGLRIGEALGLSPSSVDFEKSVLKIKCQYNPKTRKRTSPKSGNSIRTITMPIVVIEQLKEYIERIKAFNTYDEYSSELYLFGLERPFDVNTIRKWLKIYIDLSNEINEEKIPVITTRGFRHSHASYLINNMKDDYSIYDIAKRLGHTVPTLLKTYAHWFNGADRKLVDMINNNTIKEKPLERSKNAEIEQASNNESSYIEELKGLKELMDIGIITLEEFNLKKKLLLGI